MESSSRDDFEWHSDEDEDACSRDDLDEVEDGNDRQGPRRNFEPQRKAIIYLLDARKEMFREDASIENQTPFMHCLMCIRNAMRAKIRASEHSLCGILLLGTQKTDNLLDLKNISTIQPLKYLSADHMLKVDEIAKKVEDSSFAKDYGSASFSLANAFWVSFKMLSDKAKNMALKKSIILFTNDDDPIKKDRTEFDRVISSARDMLLNNILFDLMHLGENFDLSKIYKELLQLSRSDMDYEIPDPVTKMTDMVKRTNRTDFRHASLSKIPFHMVDDVTIEVSIHYLVRKVKPPFRVKLSKATNDRVVTKTQLFETNTGAVVRKENLVRAYNYGGKEIYFTQNELKHMDDFAEKGLKLLGFKPASSVNLEHYVQPCAFIYPGKPGDQEESSFFVALLSRCLERQVVPVCTFCPRSTSTLRYVALVAQEEEMAPDKTQLSPSGFLVFFLSFAEEVRDLDDKCTGKKRAAREEVDVAKQLVKKLKFQYKPEIFPNPKLAAHWSGIEALALDLKEPEPYSDSTAPNYEMMRHRTGAIVERFKDMIYGDDYDPELGILKKSSKYVKLGKAKEEGLVVDETEVREALSNGQVFKLTSNTLRLYLQQVGNSKGTSKMKKSELVERACKHLKIPVP